MLQALKFKVLASRNALFGLMLYSGDGSKMSYQLTLDDLQNNHHERRDSGLVMTINLQSSSMQRLVRQVDWIIEKDPDIVVMTEVKFNDKLEYIEGRLGYYGYHCFYNDNNDGIFRTIIASRIEGTSYAGSGSDLLAFDPRIESVTCKYRNVDLCIIGLYAPTNGQSYEQVECKREFHRRFTAELKQLFAVSSTSFLLLGDFNLLEPYHVPRYQEFEKWYGEYEDLVESGCKDAFRLFKPLANEYSWARGHLSQRLDHAFVRGHIEFEIKDVFYDHHPRENCLSDHSALMLEF